MNITTEQVALKSVIHRQTILKVINSIGKGHLGGAFSCIDLLCALYYGGVLNLSPNSFHNPLRHRFLLSKGHASIAQYVILEDLGFFKEEELFKMNNGGILGEHPDTNIPGIEFISGSLGHGLSVGVGLAVAAQRDKLNHSTYILLGDGECHEGSVWEGVLLGAHLNLTNLIVIIDRNRLCIHGDTEDINALDPLDQKWKAFGWNVKVINGHNIEEIIKSLQIRHSSKPTVLIADTVKGKGVSFMENQSQWHHGSMDNDQFELALKELQHDG